MCVLSSVFRVNITASHLVCFVCFILSRVRFLGPVVMEARIRCYPSPEVFNLKLAHSTTANIPPSTTHDDNLDDDDDDAEDAK